MDMTEHNGRKEIFLYFVLLQNLSNRLYQCIRRFYKPVKDYGSLHILPLVAWCSIYLPLTEDLAKVNPLWINAV